MDYNKYVIKPDQSRIFCSPLDTPFGPVSIVWALVEGRPTIVRVVLSNPGASAGSVAKVLFPECTRDSSPEIDLVSGQISAFLSGKAIRFSLDAVRIDACPAFQRRVLLAEFGIPRGHVSTYRRIAAHLGSPGGARAVGNALANNPFPILIPCHRAIRSDRTLGGFQGGIKMKRSLLELEGIGFNGRGQVVTDNVFY